MRYSFTYAAFAALAATVLAAPVLDRRDQDTEFVVDIVTVTTTVTVTVSQSQSSNPYYSGHYHKSTATVTAQTPDSSSSSTTLSYPSALSSSSTSSTSPPPPPPTTLISSSTVTPTPTPTTSPTTSPPVITPSAAPTTTSSTAPEAPAASPAGGSFEQEVLAAHNAARSKHSAPALTYNSTLGDFGLTVSGPCVFKHSGGPYGENLAAGYPTTTDSINAWVDEQSQYDYSNPGFSEATGHYTQVVWVGSTQVGCGWSSCNGENGTPGYFLACEYYPPGNFLGEFAQNVFAS